MNAVLAEALGIRLPIVLYELPIIGALQDAAYNWVAANRRRLPDDEPYCTQYPGECR